MGCNRVSVADCQSSCRIGGGRLMSLGSPHWDRVAGSGLSALDSGSISRPAPPPRPEPAPKQSRPCTSLWVHLIASNYSILPHPPAGEGLSLDPGVKGRGLGLYPRRQSRCTLWLFFCSSAKRDLQFFKIIKCLKLKIKTTTTTKRGIKVALDS